MRDVIPSFYATRTIGGETRESPRAPYQNIMLRNGEVVRVIHPSDTRSRSKKFFEYVVYANHRENHTAVSKLYHAVQLSDPLGGAADSLRYLLRSDPTKPVDGKPGLGSKVALLCINGLHTDALIIGGLRDSGGTDLDVGKEELARLDFEYNGVSFHVDDDGGFSVTYGGATAASGQLRDSVDKDSVGTTISVTPDGTVEVRTGDGKELVRLDRPGGKLRVQASADVTADAPAINLGDGATDALVMGDTYRQAQAQLHSQSPTGLAGALQLMAQAAGGAPPPSALALLVPGLTAAISAIAAFEAQAPTYLSRVSKTK